jgi:hypothetical protein
MTAGGPTEIRAQRPAPSDLAYLLTAVFPWSRPTVGIGLLQGVGEIGVASVFEIYANSAANPSGGRCGHPVCRARRLISGESGRPGVVRPTTVSVSRERDLSAGVAAVRRGLWRTG